MPAAAAAAVPGEDGAARVSQVLDVLDGHASLGLDHLLEAWGYRSITDGRSFLYACALEVRE
jgi:hypothetical protein